MSSQKAERLSQQMPSSSSRAESVTESESELESESESDTDTESNSDSDSETQATKPIITNTKNEQAEKFTQEHEGNSTSDSESSIEINIGSDDNDTSKNPKQSSKSIKRRESLRSKLQSFLPQIQAENALLEESSQTGEGEGVEISEVSNEERNGFDEGGIKLPYEETDCEEEEKDRWVEMDVSLGVLEDVADRKRRRKKDHDDSLVVPQGDSMHSDTEDSSTISSGPWREKDSEEAKKRSPPSDSEIEDDTKETRKSEQGVMDKLMGRKKRRKRNEEVGIEIVEKT